MCGRFSIISNSKTLAEHFRLVDSGEFLNSYNVSPTHNIPVIRLNENHERELVQCHWGLIPHWARDRKLQPINAKAETVDQKPFFKSCFRERRCLVPTNGFYEWQGSRKPKQPYYIRPAEDELFAFAGLWDTWADEHQQIISCTIITTTANDAMKFIHGRMPVILDKVTYTPWLESGSKDLLIPYPGKLELYPVTLDVNNPANDGSDLIEPISI